MNNISPTILINNIVLRKPLINDINQRYIYQRPYEFRKMCGGDVSKNLPFTMDNAQKWYNDVCNEKYEWIIEIDNKMIGTVRIKLLENKQARFAIGIFDANYCNKGIGTLVVKSIVDYTFKELMIDNIILTVLAFNERAIRCYEKCGFKIIKILKDNCQIGNEYFDDVVMSISKI